MVAHLKKCSTDQLIEELRSRAKANELKRQGNPGPVGMAVDMLTGAIGALFNIFFDWFIIAFRGLVIWLAYKVKLIWFAKKVRRIVTRLLRKL